MFIIRITELNEEMEKLDERHILLQIGNMKDLVKHVVSEPIIKEVVVERPSPFEQFQYDAFNKPPAIGKFPSKIREG